MGELRGKGDAGATGELGGKGDAGAMGEPRGKGDAGATGEPRGKGDGLVPRAREFKFKDQRTKEEGRLGNL